jgi:hypothetical protein
MRKVRESLAAKHLNPIGHLVWLEETKVDLANKKRVCDQNETRVDPCAIVFIAGPGHYSVTSRTEPVLEVLCRKFSR